MASTRQRTTSELDLTDATSPDSLVCHEGAEVGRSLAALDLDVRPLPEPGAATPEVLRATIGRRSAALFRGLARGWPALREWTPPSLAAAHGDKVVSALMSLPAGGVLFPQEQRLYEQKLPLGRFVEAMLSASPQAPCYLAYKRANEIFPARDYDFTSLLGPLEAGNDTRAWIGSAGTRSMLHSDLKDNLFCQIWGHKHVVLLAWEDSTAAYPFPDNIVNSRLDLADLDLASHPRLRGKVLYAGTMGPGDVLFIPRGWWHDIRSKTPSVSLNHWFGAPLGLRGYLPLVLKLGPRCWYATAKDFLVSGVLGRQEPVNFFFSPPSTGRRIFDALRWRDFSRGNDPSK